MRRHAAVPHRAPGTLETLRTFVNTWRIPNSTRVPEDHLPWLLRNQRAWVEAFPDVPRARLDTLERLTALREGLRQVIQRGDCAPISSWLQAIPPVTEIGEAGKSVAYRAAPGTGLAGHLLAAVVGAIAVHEWPRLKACPDCRWVFYDRSRNCSRVWCGMLAGNPTRRACGTIAKVRRWRQRHARAEP